MLQLRHATRLVREFAAFTFVNRAWWFPVVVALVAGAVVVSVAGATAAPFTIYTLF